MGDYNFIETFNDYYPFERYIVKNPKQINELFDDAVLTEIFIPSTEIKPLIDDGGNFQGYSEIPDDEIYVKLKCNNVEFRMAYWDFNDHIREEIRTIILNDFGHYEWQSLYVEYEEEYEYDELKDALKIQYNLIKEKYGECNLKSNIDDWFDIDADLSPEIPFENSPNELKSNSYDRNRN